MSPLASSVARPRIRRGSAVASADELRVAMAIDSFRPVLGGAQRQIERLAPLLAIHGVRATVLTRRSDRALPRRAREGTLDVVRLPGSGLVVGGAWAYVAGGAAWLALERPAVVHAHGLLAACALALAGTVASRVPVVVKPLSSGPHGDLARLRTKPGGGSRLRWIVRRAAAFVCVGDEIAAELRALGVEGERIARIPNGVDVDRFRPRNAADGPTDRLRRSWGLPGDGPLVVTAGRLDPRKRLDRVIVAQARAPGTLAIVGDGPDRARLERVADLAGIGDRVRLLPAVDDLAPLLRIADAYVTASDQDGLSNAVLEAMACGLPVVATRAGGMAELVDATTGVLVEEATADRLGGALATLLADPVRARRLGVAGRERVVAGFALTATADRLAALYRTLEERR